MSQVTDDSPLDPFLGDPADPAAALQDLDDSDGGRHAPLADRAGGRAGRHRGPGRVPGAALPRGVRGIVVECSDCGESHYFGWDLMRSNLRHLLDVGRTRVHEPAFGPDPARYVSWEYARGFADGAFAAAEAEAES